MTCPMSESRIAAPIIARIAFLTFYYAVIEKLLRWRPLNQRINESANQRIGESANRRITYVHTFARAHVSTFVL